MSSRRNRTSGRFDIDMTPLQDFMRQMDSFFNQSFKQMNEHLHLNPFWVDVTENETHYIIKAELADYNRDQIQIEASGNQLRIEIKDFEVVDQKDLHNNSNRKKQSFMKKERIITFPFEIPKKETKASFRNHHLTITIPKQNSARKFIEIDY